jgi:hypothetical protein
VRQVSERRRLVLLVVIMLGALTIGLLDATVPQRPGTASAGAAVPPLHALAATESSAWYCAGPLPVGARLDSSSLAVANLAAHPVRAELEVATTTGAALVTRSFSVAPQSQALLPLPRSGAPRWAAATLLFEGGGAAVEELVSGPRGVASAPCSDGAAARSYFPSGSTSGPRNLTLALYDPLATPAVASVTVSTGSGTTSPPPLQDVAVGSHQMVVLDIGRQVPQQPVIATTVSTTAGELVAGALLVFPRRGGGIREALADGSPDAASCWRFAPAPLGPFEHEVFTVLDPGARSATVRLTLGSGRSSAELQATVPAGGVTVLTPPPTAVPSMAWATLTSVRGGPVIAGREAVVLQRSSAGGAPSAAVPRSAAPRATVPLRAASPRASAQPSAAQPSAAQPSAAQPSAVFAVGTAVQLGLTSPADEWVLPGDGTAASESDVVVVANPGPRPATVVLRSLPGSDSAGRPAPGLSAQGGLRLSIGGGGEVTLGLASLPGAGTGRPAAVLVEASSPVLAGSFLSTMTAASALAGVDGIPVSD